MDCSTARSVWALAEEGLVEQMCQHQIANAKNFIFALHDSLSHSEFIRMVVTLWATWGARRKAIYEDILQSPLSTHLFIEAYLNDLQILDKSTRATGTVPHRGRLSGFLHPGT